MQFLFLRERLDFTQQEIVDKMGVMCQLITRFDNMSNSLIIFILVKWANELATKTWYYFEWRELIELSNNKQIWNYQVCLWVS